MSESTLYRLTKEDLPKAVACLKDAFAEDPLWAEVFKHDPNKEQALNGFFACPLLYGLKYGKVYATSADIESAAVWVPGKLADMSFLRMLLSGAMSFGAKMGRESMRRLSITAKQMGPDRRRLMKNTPFVYLMIIGVSSAAQRKGLGSRLLNVIKDECDAQGLHLYLETETEQNVRFYEKHGFTLLEKTVIKELDLPIWEMVRKPGQ